MTKNTSLWAVNINKIFAHCDRWSLSMLLCVHRSRRYNNLWAAYINPRL